MKANQIEIDVSYIATGTPCYDDTITEALLSALNGVRYISYKGPSLILSNSYGQPEILLEPY